jgi:hypothetical protein
MNALLYVWEWFARHPERAVTAVLTVLIAVWKAVPPERRAAIEAQHPRLVNTIRVLYAIFPDVAKAFAALVAAVRAEPKYPPDIAPSPSLHSAEKEPTP